MTTQVLRGPDRERFRELADRYDRPGPRYTSYPTAVEFHPGFTATDYEARLEAANALGDAPLSIYMHLPFCEQRCLFCGCHVIITRKKDRARPYLELLSREIDMVATRLPDRRKFSQLHLGGGTPTYYSPSELEGLLKGLLSKFSPTANAELAIEVDPRVTTTAHIDALASLGFNRVSMGVQDFTPAVQERVNRVQSVEQTKTIIDRCRQHGFKGVNVDLIYGLPMQTPESFDRSIQAVIDMGADRVAAYSLALVPWIRGHQKKLEPSELPPREVKLELLAVTRDRLIGAGYVPIGMDHFARPTDELAVALREGRLRRNFQGYAVIPGDDVLGFGISAIGDVRGAYVQNEKKLSRYQEAIEREQLPVERGVARSQDDELRREVIHQLMCTFAVDKASFERKYSIQFDEYFAEDLERLAEYRDGGLIEVSETRIDATPTGEIFVRNLAMCFDRYMREKRASSSSPLFSRTV